MFVKRSVAIVIPFLVFAGSASALPPVERAAEVIAARTIPALLLRPGKSAESLYPRQANDDQCDVGYHHCDGTEGCCQIGYYCGTWDGKRGCCPNGESCIANDDPCEYEDYFPCSGETFCCPNGSTCSRDSFGSPQCTTSGGGSSLSRSASLSPTRTLASSTSRASSATLPPATVLPSDASNEDITSSRSANVITAATSSRNTGTVTLGSLSTAPAASAFGNGGDSNAVAAIWVVAGVALNLLYM